LFASLVRMPLTLRRASQACTREQTYWFGCAEPGCNDELTADQTTDGRTYGNCPAHGFVTGKVLRAASTRV
jgi:hypothetical protein